MTSKYCKKPSQNIINLLLPFLSANTPVKFKNHLVERSGSFSRKCLPLLYLSSGHDLINYNYNPYRLSGLEPESRVFSGF